MTESYHHTTHLERLRREYVHMLAHSVIIENDNCSCGRCQTTLDISSGMTSCPKESCRAHWNNIVLDESTTTMPYSFPNLPTISAETLLMRATSRVRNRFQNARRGKRIVNVAVNSRYL